MADATSIFTLITGYPPYDYQRVLAERKRPPGVVEVPTGSGKTLAVLLPWLLDERGPRRLVYALPMRSLVEQTAEVVHAALAATGRDDVDAHVLMGGEEMREWQRAPARRAVLVGTIDMLLSRALGRGYGESRYAWPVSFGLLNSDCRWIFDEVQLMGPARTTSAQLAGLRALLGTARPCETVWMSATIDHAALATVDHPRADDVVRLSAADRAGPLARRLNARKELVRLDLGGIEPKDTERLVPEAVLDRHRPATRTIVVLNRVDAAQQLHASLVKRASALATPPSVVLLHSRYRPADRAVQMQQALAAPDPAGGTIVVATQVIEAGVDLSSALLVTETAPFSSMVQRLGRCNRAGELEAATVLWIDRGDPVSAKAAAPYEVSDLTAAREAFLALQGESASPARLESIEVHERSEVTAVLRRRDLLDLFDTAPDLSGADVDIGPFIRADDERTVSVFFREFGDGGTAGQAAAQRDELVDVPIAAVTGEKRARRWTLDHIDGAWMAAHKAHRIVPGQVVMLAAHDGGYDARRGWTGKPTDVPDVVTTANPPTPPEGMASNSGSENEPAWVSVADHLDDAAAAARELVAAVAFAGAASDAVVRAAALHDVGKVHDAFQEMLLGTVKDEAERQARRSAGVWAKSANHGGRHVRPFFRHELASALMLAGADPELLGDSPALVRYLVAAHHGRVRMSIRPAPGEAPPDAAADRDGGRRYALGVIEGDAVAAVATPLGRLPAGTLELDEMELGGGRGDSSWSAQALALLDQHGPFRLAYMEALVRVADWRASG